MWENLRTIVISSAMVLIILGALIDLAVVFMALGVVATRWREK